MGLEQLSAQTDPSSPQGDEEVRDFQQTEALMYLLLPDPVPAVAQSKPMTKTKPVQVITIYDSDQSIMSDKSLRAELSGAEAAPSSDG